MPLSKRIAMGAGIGFLLFLANAALNILIRYSFGIPDGPDAQTFSQITLEFAFSVLVIAPITEEFLFRATPITITTYFTDNQLVLWIAIVASSALWGWLHPYPYGIISIGALGIPLSMLYIRYGYASSVAAHMAWNTIVLLLYALNALKYF